MTRQICDACECVSHCRKNGCVPLTPRDQAPVVTSSTDPKYLREALDKTFELFVQERIFSKELVSVLSSALQTAEFERHPYRAWHGEARRALKKVPQ